jgi:putative peptidoglycan lipid II flippase
MSGNETEVPASPETERRAERITQRAAVVALGTFTSRLLGLGRELVVAAYFSRAITDAFFVAFQIPNILRQLLAEGAVQNAVIPVLSKVLKEEGDDRAKDYFRNVRGLSTLLLLLVTALGMIFAEQVVRLFAPGFATRPGQLEETVRLTRWVFPYIFLIGTASLSSAALNTHRRFFATSFSPLLLNVSFIGAALVLPAWLMHIGQPADLSLALGALLGGVLQILALWPDMRRIGYVAWPGFRFKDPALIESLRRMGPTLIGIGVYYLDVILGRRFLSDLGEGAVTYFGFALRLCDFPQGIFVMALQTATLPSLASLVAAGNRGEVAGTFAFSVRVSLLVGIGATALVLGLSEPLVRLLFERGEFGPHDTVETSRALVAQGLGIWLVAAIRQVTVVFFALGDTKTPVLVASLDLVAFVLLCFGLKGSLGHVGVGLAVSGASLVQLVLLWAFLRRKLPLPEREVLVSALRFLPPALAAGFLAYGVAHVDLGPGRLVEGAKTLVAFGVGLGAYLGLAAALGSPELGPLLSLVRRKLRVARR